MFYNILDKKRKSILPFLEPFKDDFYLAGGTAQKDYVDLYYILQNHKLDRLLLMAKKKFPEIDINLIIKSLVYFDDIVEEPIIFMNDNHMSLSEIKTFLSRRVQEYFI